MVVTAVCAVETTSKKFGGFPWVCGFSVVETTSDLGRVALVDRSSTVNFTTGKRSDVNA